jgi:hypothetical protein
MDDAYLDRTEEDASPYKFKLELAEGTFEMYGHISTDGFMDYSFFLDQKELDGGFYGGYYSEDNKFGDFEPDYDGSLYHQEWGYLVSDVLGGYDFKSLNWK